MHLFLASNPLEFIAMVIVEPSPKTKQGSPNILVIIDRYFKLTKAISTLKMTSKHVASMLEDHWHIQYGIRAYLLTDNKTRFVSKYFATVRALVGIILLTATANPSQTASQAKRLKETVIARL